MIEKKLIKNKLGDVPVMILVIGVLVIVGIAILSFLFVLGKNNETFHSYALVEETNSAIDQYYFYKNINLPQSDIDNALKLEIDRSSGKRYINITKDNGKVSVIYVLPN
jgi:hypothetical protein